MKKTILLLGVICLTATSCKKEKFIGRQSFWYGEDVAQALVDDDVEKLTLYVDGAVVGTIGSDIYYTAKPECKEGLFVYEDKMYRKEVATHNYKIVDEYGDTQWEGSFTTKESLCSDIELTN